MNGSTDRACEYTEERWHSKTERWTNLKGKAYKRGMHYCLKDLSMGQMEANE